MRQHIANRRQIIAAITASAALPVLAACGSSPAQAKAYPVRFSEAEWRKRLSKDQFWILREAGTERRFSSPLTDEKRAGTYHCAGCDNHIYSSQTKYDSATGWPAFWQSEPSAIETATDYKLGFPRTEALCADCGSHLGHIFGDGPKPTGKRHCINGLAMDFRPSKA